DERRDMPVERLRAVEFDFAGHPHAFGGDGSELAHARPPSGADMVARPAGRRRREKRQAERVRNIVNVVEVTDLVSMSQMRRKSLPPLVDQMRPQTAALV